MKRLLFLAALLFAAPAAAQTVIFSCTFDGAGATVGARFQACATAYSLTGTLNDTAHIALGTGFSGQGMAETFTSGQSYATSFYHTFPSNTKAITMVWYERYSAWPGSNGNSKDIRLYNGSYGSNDYYVNNIPAHFSDDEHFSNWHTGIATMNPAAVTAVSLGCGCAGCTGPRCCYDGENGCPLGNNQYTTTPTDGSQPGRLNFAWSIAGHNFQDLAWHKMRLYARMPTSSGATDGEIRFWIDETDIFDLTSVGRLAGGDNYTVLSWFPAEDGTGNYVHYIDEIIVYSGLVLPGVTSVCGNGQSESGETCDDGNTTTETDCTYGTPTCTNCSADCSTVLNLTGPYCGDNILNGTEPCDTSQLNSQTCATQFCRAGTLTCSSCAFNVSACGLPFRAMRRPPIGWGR